MGGGSFPAGSTFKAPAPQGYCTSTAAHEFSLPTFVNYLAG